MKRLAIVALLAACGGLAEEDATPAASPPVRASTQPATNPSAANPPATNPPATNPSSPLADYLCGGKERKGCPAGKYCNVGDCATYPDPVGACIGYSQPGGICGYPLGGGEQVWCAEGLECDGRYCHDYENYTPTEVSADWSPSVGLTLDLTMPSANWLKLGPPGPGYATAVNTNTKEITIRLRLRGDRLTPTDVPTRRHIDLGKVAGVELGTTYTLRAFDNDADPDSKSPLIEKTVTPTLAP